MMVMMMITMKVMINTVVTTIMVVVAMRVLKFSKNLGVTSKFYGPGGGGGYIK